MVYTIYRIYTIITYIYYILLLEGYIYAIKCITYQFHQRISQLVEVYERVQIKPKYIYNITSIVYIYIYIMHHLPTDLHKFFALSQPFRSDAASLNTEETKLRFCGDCFRQERFPLYMRRVSVDNTWGDLYDCGVISINLLCQVVQKEVHLWVGTEVRQINRDED